MSSYVFSENRAVYEVMWKNMDKPDRPQFKIQYGAWALSRWLTKATKTHSEYVIRFAFPRQLCRHKGALILRCTYIVFLLYMPLEIQILQNILGVYSSGNLTVFYTNPE